MATVNLVPMRLLSIVLALTASCASYDSVAGTRYPDAVSAVRASAAVDLKCSEQIIVRHEPRPYWRIILWSATGCNRRVVYREVAGGFNTWTYVREPERK